MDRMDPIPLPRKVMGDAEPSPRAGRIELALQMPDSDDGTLHYIAAAPPDYRTSFAGSGLPFQNERAAMDLTPTEGTLSGAPGAVQKIDILYPNSYRDSRGWVVPPAVHLSWRQGGAWKRAIRFLGPAIPHRALSYEPSRCARKIMFYAGTHELPVRGQEAILRSGGFDGGPAYTAASPAYDFWGLRPRL